MPQELTGAQKRALQRRGTLAGIQADNWAAALDARQPLLRLLPAEHRDRFAPRRRANQPPTECDRVPLGAFLPADGASQCSEGSFRVVRVGPGQMHACRSSQLVCYHTLTHRCGTTQRELACLRMLLLGAPQAGVWALFPVCNMGLVGQSRQGHCCFSLPTPGGQTYVATDNAHRFAARPRRCTAAPATCRRAAGRRCSWASCARACWTSWPAGRRRGGRRAPRWAWSTACTTSAGRSARMVRSRA